MTVTTFTIDGIIKPDGAPVILEYNRGMNSGSVGYRSFTGKKIIHRIMRDLKAAGYAHIWFEGRDIAYAHFDRRRVPYSYNAYHYYSGRTPVDCPDPHHPVLRHLMYPAATMPRFSCEGSQYGYEVPEIDYSKLENLKRLAPEPAKGGDHIEIADFPAVFNDFYNSKAHIPQLLQKGVLDPACYPKQKHYIVTNAPGGPEALAEKILSDFKGAAQLMVKHPSLCQGDGIIAVKNPSRKKVKRAVRRIRDHGQRGLSYNERDPGHKAELVVQEFVESRTMSVRQSFLEASGYLRSVKEARKTLQNYIAGDDQPRNYAFRLFISYVNGDLILHDGWLKFSDHAVDAPKHDKFISGRKYAGPLSEERKQEIFQALKPNMLTLFRHLEAEGKRLTNKTNHPPEELLHLLPLENIIAALGWSGSLNPGP
jgi:hypothetical protein